MRPQAARVLKLLQKYGADTGSNLALVLGVPEPSVRRSIQELIDEGHNITFTTGSNKCYMLVEPAPAGQAGDSTEAA
jgi:biotin operon repressor